MTNSYFWCQITRRTCFWKRSIHHIILFLALPILWIIASCFTATVIRFLESMVLFNPWSQLFRSVIPFSSYSRFTYVLPLYTSASLFLSYDFRCSTSLLQNSLFVRTSTRRNFAVRHISIWKDFKSVFVVRTVNSDSSLQRYNENWKEYIAGPSYVTYNVNEMYFRLFVQLSRKYRLACSREMRTFLFELVSISVMWHTPLESTTTAGGKSEKTGTYGHSWYYPSTLLSHAFWDRYGKALFMQPESICNALPGIIIQLSLLKPCSGTGL